MKRAIVGYHLDEAKDWVAELACGHNQHVRHRPPFQLRPWVVDAAGRAGKLGTPLDCPLCDRAELPGGLRLVRSSPEWDERTIPSALLRAHQIAGGMWGRILVRRGHLHFRASTTPPLAVVVGPAATQPIPPDVEHVVEPLGAVRFSIDFLAANRSDQRVPVRDVLIGEHPATEEGGDPACWAGLLCPECAAVLDGGAHRPGCQAASEGCDS